MSEIITYPDITVRLIGKDGNAFAIIGKVSTAMRNARVPEPEIAAFNNAAFDSKSYDDLLQLVMRTVEVE